MVLIAASAVGGGGCASTYGTTYKPLSEKDQAAIMADCEFLAQDALDSDCLLERHAEFVEAREESAERRHSVVSNLIDAVGQGLMDTILLRVDHGLQDSLDDFLDDD